MIEPKYGSFGINETITHSPSIQSHKNKCKSFFLETKLGFMHAAPFNFCNIQINPISLNFI
jgi:hypothetical protein